MFSVRFVVPARVAVAVTAAALLIGPLCTPAQANHLAAPVSAAPSDGACFTSGTTISFDWSTVSGADLYRLEIDEADQNWSDPWLRKHPWPSHQDWSAPPAGDYKWRVQARADSGTHVSAWSEVRSFTVVPTCLTAPVLSAPAEGATFSLGATVNYDWSDVAGADLYRIEVDEVGGDWSTPIYRKHPWGSQDSLAAPTTLGDYKWRVQARADSGASVGPWSEVRTFSVVDPNAPPPPPPPPSGVIYGSAMTPHTQARWNEVTALLGPLQMPRGFSTHLPSNYENAEWHWHNNAGLTGLISVKPNVTDTVNGTNYNAIKNFAATVPNGTWITAWHEPENDSPLQNGVFVDMLCNFATAVRDGNPTLQVGYAAMAYQWGSGRASTADPTDWTPAMDCVDWVGVDVYSYDWSGPDDSLYEHQEFQRWYSHFKDFAGPVGIIERGISQFATGGTRAHVLERDLEFVAEHGLDVYLYWNADANEGRPEVWVMDNDPQACAVLATAAEAAVS